MITSDFSTLKKLTIFIKGPTMNISQLMIRRVQGRVNFFLRISKLIRSMTSTRDKSTLLLAFCKTSADSITRYFLRDLLSIQTFKAPYTFRQL